MWNEFLNASRSQKKFQNKPLVILGSKHSGKRSLVDSLFDISKTTIHNKRLASQMETNKMKLKGLITAIDYAYINVLDLSDIDNRTHTKLQVYMIEEPQKSQIYGQLANKELLRKAIFIIMLDFTNPWNFTSQLAKWINFIYELQKRAGFTVIQLQQMAKEIQMIYKRFSEPEFDQSGKLKKKFDFAKKDEEQIDIPLPEGVLEKNMRLRMIVCVNKCDLQTQVFRDESNYKISFVMYHLREFCVRHGASLIYTSIKNNSNLNLIYEYILHLGYRFPFRFKSEDKNEEAFFIPIGYDNFNLIKDSVVKMDVTKPYSEVIAEPQNKKIQKEDILVEEDSKYFQKFINNQPALSLTAVTDTSSISSSSINRSISDEGKKTSNATIFFKNLLTGGTKGPNLNNSEIKASEVRVTEAEKYLQKHTREVMKKKQ